MVSNKYYAVVAGVGPGTGRSVALKFSEAYPVVLLARRPESYTDVVAQINKAGGKAIGITADATDESSLASAFEAINKEFPGLQLVAAIYNVRPNSRPSRRPFLELKLEDLDTSLNGNVYVISHKTSRIQTGVLLTEIQLLAVVSSLLLKM
jgi:NAD(P)-dependent dehydrogenase (short-subunit alcohol dehydrogenase family)